MTARITDEVLTQEEGTGVRSVVLTPLQDTIYDIQTRRGWNAYITATHVGFMVRAMESTFLTGAVVFIRIVFNIFVHFSINNPVIVQASIKIIYSHR